MAGPNGSLAAGRQGYCSVTNTPNKNEWDFFSTTLIEEARTAIWKTRARIEPRELIEHVKEKLQALAAAAQGAESEQMVWDKVRETLVAAAYETRPYCLKCGTCCKKDTPSLLMEDMPLLRHDVIRPEHLYTVRKGETVYSALEDETVELTHEIIKVQSVKGTSRCIFFRGLDGLCSIYDNRPMQCRLQECWNPDRMTHISLEYITREHVFGSVDQLLEVIKAHEERCSVEVWKRAMERLAATRGHSVAEVLELLKYDHIARRFLQDKFGVKSEVSALVLGRPLKDSLPLYGLELAEDPGGAFVLQPISENT